MNYIFLITLAFLANMLVAQTNSDSLEALLPQKEGLEKIELLNKLSNFYWKVSPDKGLKYSQEAYSIALKADNKAKMATALQNSGINYWAKSEYYSALEHYQKSLKIFEELNDQKGIASLYSNIGIIYDNLSVYENALKYYLASLDISEKEGFKSIHNKSLTNIGLVYLAQKNYEKASSYFQRAIKLSKEQNDTIYLSAHLNNLGRTYDEQKDYLNAKKFYKEALELNLKNKDNYGTTICLYNIGTTEYNLKNYGESMDYYKKSLHLSQKIDDKIGVLLAYKSIGSIYKDQQEYGLALDFYHKSMLLAYQLKAKEERLDVLKNYYELYKVTGNLKKSLDFFEQYVSLKDSIYNEESAKQLAEVQTKYESEKKEKENELLRKNSEIKDLEIAKQMNLRNSFIGLFVLVILFIGILFNRFKIKKEANLMLSQKNILIEEQKKQLILNNNKLTEQYDQLKLLNTMKDKFFQIISHDLRGPFNSILGFTELLNADYHSFDDSNRIGLIKEIDKSAHLAYELLINLLTWAQAQTGEIKIIKEPLNLKELVESSVRLYGLNASLKNIDIVVNIPDNTILSIDRDTSLTFIGNLINNAIKFTPEGGLISINCYDEKNYIKVHIVDTGVGMPPEVLEKLFRIDENITTLGTNNEKGTGLGLVLCKEFIERNNGKISVRSEVGKGSEFIISLPKKNND